jgi:carboxyl-terminal processing protease
MGKYKTLTKLGGLALLTLALVWQGSWALQTDAAVTGAVTQLSPTASHQDLDKAIAHLLTRYHYKQSKLDDELSEIILDNYIESLDFNRSYFLASDIDNFKKYRLSLDDYLRSGNLRPAYTIFNVYRQRLAERTERILGQLHQEIDFMVDESLDLDRSEAPWAKSRAELDELWRRRLKNELLTLMLAGKDLNGARETLEKRYQRLRRRTNQSNSEDVFQLYMNAVSRGFDPHTAYFSPRTSENFNIQMRLSLEGIGAVLRMEEELVTVVELVPGGPADLSKQIKPEDKIVAVGQGNGGPMEDIVGWRLDDVVEIIRGQRGSVVRLQVIPGADGADALGKTVRLVRDTVKLEKQAAKSELRVLMAGGRKVRVGVITIPTFYNDFAAAQQGARDYRSTTRDVRRLLEDLQRAKVDGVVIDLRQNGGGALQEAVELTGLFIQDGPVVQVRNTNGRVEVENDPDPNQIYGGPLVILVDRFSASASEIFAGAVQDYGRGIVVGESTFGKGTVQTLVDLKRFVPQAKDPSGQLKLTIAKFYRINGSSTQNRGVVPDIQFPTAFDSDEVGESAEGHALPWDTIRSVRYQGDSGMAELVPEIDRLHQARINKDPAFKKLAKDIETAKKARDKTVVSLMRSRRIAERETLEARQQASGNQRHGPGILPELSDEDETAEKDDENAPDIFLDESIRILADLVNLANKHTPANRVVMTAE